MKKDCWLFGLFRVTDAIRQKIRGITPSNIAVRKTVCVLWIATGILAVMFIITERRFFVYGAAILLIGFMIIDYITELQAASHSARKFLGHFLLNDIAAAFLLGVMFELIIYTDGIVLLLLIYFIFFALSVLVSLIAEESVSKVSHAILSVFLTIVAGFAGFVNNLFSLAPETTEMAVQIKALVSQIKTLFDIFWFPLTLVSIVCTVLAAMKGYWREKHANNTEDQDKKSNTPEIEECLENQFGSDF